MFIDVKVDAAAARQPELVKKLVEVCPVAIFAQAENGGLRILDWEYAGMGDVFFDLANLSRHHDFSETQDVLLLQAYFGQATPQRLARLRLMRVASDLREAIMQRGRIVFIAYGRRALGQNVARVEPNIHLHDGHAGLRVTVQDCGLNWRRTAIPGQQRSVYIQATPARQIQNCPRQDLPERRHCNQLRLQLSEFRNELLITCL